MLDRSYQVCSPSPAMPILQIKKEEERILTAAWVTRSLESMVLQHHQDPNGPQLQGHSLHPELRLLPGYHASSQQPLRDLMA